MGVEVRAHEPILLSTPCFVHRNVHRGVPPPRPYRRRRTATTSGRLLSGLLVVVNLGGSQPDGTREILDEIPGIADHVPHAVHVVVVLGGRPGSPSAPCPQLSRGEGNLDGHDAAVLVLERDAGVVPVPDGQADADLHVLQRRLGGQLDLEAGLAAFGNRQGGDGVAAGVLPR